MRKEFFKHSLGSSRVACPRVIIGSSQGYHRVIIGSSQGRHKVIIGLFRESYSEKVIQRRLLG